MPYGIYLRLVFIKSLTFVDANNTQPKVCCAISIMPTKHIMWKETIIVMYVCSCLAFPSITFQCVHHAV